MALCLSWRDLGISTGAKLETTLAALAKDTTEGVKAPIRLPVSTAPVLVLVLVLSSGTPEALKWLALLLMTLGHVNKQLLHASVPELFAAGQVKLNVPRGPLSFYVYYPTHPAVFWGLAQRLSPV